MMTFLLILGIAMFAVILGLVLITHQCELEDEARKEVIEQMKEIAERY